MFSFSMSRLSGVCCICPSRNKHWCVGNTRDGCASYLCYSTDSAWHLINEVIASTAAAFERFWMWPNHLHQLRHFSRHLNKINLICMKIRVQIHSCDHNNFIQYRYKFTERFKGAEQMLFRWLFTKELQQCHR